MDPDPSLQGDDPLGVSFCLTPPPLVDHEVPHREIDGVDAQADRDLAPA